MKIIYQKDWVYTLYEDEHSLILSVVVGMTALYEMEVRLTLEEQISYQKEGVSFLDRFSENVRNQPRNYENRKLH